MSSAFAPVPSPSISTAGTTRYPNPGSIISTVSNSPSTMLARRIACLVLTVPTADKSIKVSTVASYKFSTAFGISSTKFKLLKLIVSANASFLKIVFTFSTTVFKIGRRSTNILCLGLYCTPYFCLAGSLVSGTLLPDLSLPIKLSIHLFSKEGVGKLSATPSVSS